MKASTLKSVLLKELGAAEEGGVLAVPSERKVTVITRYDNQLIAVAKVRGVRITEDFVNIVGDAEELFVAADCDFIVKSEASRRQDDVRPGFH